VLFDKIASVYFTVSEKYINILALEMATQGTGTVPFVSAHFRSVLRSQGRSCGKVTSQNLWLRYDRHLVGIT